MWPGLGHHHTGVTVQARPTAGPVDVLQFEPCLPKEFGEPYARLGSGTGRSERSQFPHHRWTTRGNGAFQVVENDLRSDPVQLHGGTRRQEWKTQLNLFLYFAPGGSCDRAITQVEAE